MKQIIDGLTGIRAVAMIWVVVIHLDLLLEAGLPGTAGIAPLIAAGNLGVDLFFVLSGFVIAYTYLDRLESPEKGRVQSFLWLRVARIYPAHLVTFLGFGLLVLVASFVGISLNSADTYTPLSFLMNLVMLQAVPPAIPWNNPAWSISTEFAAYLAFPLIALLIPKLRRRGVVLWLAGIYLVGGAALWMVVATAADWPYWGGYALMWLRIVIGFPAGCLLFVLWRSVKHRITPIGYDVMGAVAVAGVVVASFLDPGTEAVVLPVPALPFLALLVLAAAGTGRVTGAILGNRVFVWLGTVSYSVYLTHFMVVLLAERLIGARLTGSSALVQWGFILALVAVVIVVGWVCYRFVEEPSRRLLKALPESVRSGRDRAARRRRDARTPPPSSATPAAPAPVETVPAPRPDRGSSE